MFGNDEYNAGQWEEVELALEPSGKAPKKYGEGIFRFYASLTLSVILPRRGWTLIKQNKNYVYLKPPLGNDKPPFLVKIRIPNKEQAIAMANDCYNKAESWMGQIGEWPVWYTHKQQLQGFKIVNDPITGQTKEELDHIFDPESTLQIGQFGVWENRITKTNDDEFKVYESGIIKRAMSEIKQEVDLIEGREFIVELTKFERNSAARKKCIEHYGSVCQICGFDFSKVFGRIGEGFIHVHHIVPISEQDGEYEVNPISDLLPVCPNCHAMIHRKDPPYSITGLKEILLAVKDSK